VEDSGSAGDAHKGAAAGQRHRWRACTTTSRDPLATARDTPATTRARRPHLLRSRCQSR
jgi:hypothetical protein